jgi:hypothetical protein
MARLQTAGWRGMTIPVLILQTGRPDPAAARFCTQLPSCRLETTTDAHAAEVAAIEAQLPPSLSNPSLGR